VELIEMKRGGVSFTAETIEALSSRDPYCCWMFLMGSDHLYDFLNWHKSDRILKLASLAVNDRIGYSYSLLPDKLLSRLRSKWSGNPGELVMLRSVGLNLASSGLRHSLSLCNIPKGVSSRVLADILHNGYYR
jgi:nicotinic acid mononucleotide adenylyltransferase